MEKYVEFTINAESKDVAELQKKHLTHDTYMLNVKNLLCSKDVEPEIIEGYQAKQESAVFEFEQAKLEFEKKYIPEALYGKHKYDWDVEYATDVITVKVYCDCGIEIVKELGVEYLELER